VLVIVGPCPRHRGAMNRLSSLPSVEKLLQTDEAAALAENFGRPLTVDAIRATLDQFRDFLREDTGERAPEAGEILIRAEAQLRSWTKPGIRTLINATGVILHTNLGRAPLAEDARQAMAEASTSYTNLEFDLETGKRSERLLQASALLQRLTGAEAGIVVNNNAAAVLLALTALTRRKRVLVARSQLVEIGGGFRMPDVMRQSGTRLIEVGTTNRVRLPDYEERFDEAAAVLRAHRSNFKMTGFVEDPALEEIVQAAHKAGLFVIDDLGSGTLLDTSAFGLVHEPTVQESVNAGADIVCFSGDKLLGGPQAGILIGRSSLISKLRRHPLARALRADKTCLAGLAATLEHYLRNDAARAIPVWQMISISGDTLKQRAKSWQDRIGTGEVCPSESTLGGGSLPGETLPTHVLSLAGRNSQGILKRLREQEPPIIARAEKGSVLLDPRTVLAEQDAALVAGLLSALKELQ
jgi:L-seryl-tRNA(Ser) seleniumtransferase